MIRQFKVPYLGTEMQRTVSPITLSKPSSIFIRRNLLTHLQFCQVGIARRGPVSPAPFPPRLRVNCAARWPVQREKINGLEGKILLTACIYSRGLYIGKYPPPPPPRGGGINMAWWGKDIMKTTRARRQKRRQRKKGQGKRKDKWQKDRARTMFHKIMGNLEKKCRQ